MSGKVWFDPTSDKWVLSDGEHYLEVPHWAREIIADEFKSENAKLRESLEYANNEWEKESMEYLSTQVDNAKLRELVERMARALGVGSNLCDRNCGWEFECDLVSCPIEEAMRELGIEVGR